MYSQFVSFVLFEIVLVGVESHYFFIDQQRYRKNVRSLPMNISQSICKYLVLFRFNVVSQMVGVYLVVVCTSTQLPTKQQIRLLAIQEVAAATLKVT